MDRAAPKKQQRRYDHGLKRSPMFGRRNHGNQERGNGDVENDSLAYDAVGLPLRLQNRSPLSRDEDVLSDRDDWHARLANALVLPYT